ncbi:PREDICTED: uncharacterized protein LOC106106922 [Papilio polytes]|uniref:uncharacterized protein LOC106106922 n=1 Tax=Papilio polytes TaxID=76194 RepID=UPI000676461D|nr:PREDICTED: uncharacterized protein LOC106106922 [Papilio polytes]
MMWTKILLSFVTAILLVEIVSSFQSSNNISYRSVLNRRRRNTLKCILPSQPENGEYKVTGGNVINGRAMVLNLQYTCKPTYALVGDGSAFCYDGEWTPVELPKCVRE